MRTPILPTEMEAPEQAPEQVFYDARYYLYQRISDVWYWIDMIPLPIRRQAIEILTTGKVGRRMVIENDDWTAFKLVPGETTILKYQ